MNAADYYEAFYSDFFQYMKKRRIYVSDKQKKNIGDAWLEMLHELVGQLVCDRRKGSSVNMIFDEMRCLFPHIFSIEIINEDDQLICVFETLRYVRKLRKQMQEEKECTK